MKRLPLSLLAHWAGGELLGDDLVIGSLTNDTRTLVPGSLYVAPGVQLVDRLGDLNRVFADTQISAAELKLMSCVLIVLLLILPFGFGGALRIVALPLMPRRGNSSSSTLT